MKNTSKNQILILVKPTFEYQNQIMEYKKEFLDYHDSLHGGSGLQDISDFGSWMNHLEDMATPDRLPEGRVLSSEYLSIRLSDQKLVGMVNIRHYLNEELSKFGGHIGYSIRPTERNKGYAHEQLKLALKICDELSINPILLTCNKDNEASRKTIIKALGIKENEVVEDDGNIVERYWINRLMGENR